MSVRNLAALIFAISAGCAGEKQQAATDPAPIVAAERAFAADGYDRGVKASFLAFAAPDAVMFAPGPQNAHALMSAAPDPDPSKPRKRLVWWPLYAGIASSGDLGFTTGPYAFDDARAGHYFTVWKKQPDGQWKWVLDSGVGADASGQAAKDSPVAYLAKSAAKSDSAKAAFEDVQKLEAAIAATSEIRFRDALNAYLVNDSRLHGEGPAPSTDPKTRGGVFSIRPARATLHLLGGGASAAGDFAWTYGEVKSDAGVGYFARVWQKRDIGWRIVFDEYLPPPAA